MKLKISALLLAVIMVLSMAACGNGSTGNGTGNGTAYIYMNNGAGLERLPYRGGNWLTGASAGVFALHLGNARSNVSTSIGFRAAFYE